MSQFEDNMDDQATSGEQLDVHADAPNVAPDVSLDEMLASEVGPTLPTSAQLGAALAAVALVSPAALGGIPVLPVTVDDERLRQEQQMLQESESSVGVHQNVQEAQTALTLSQQRLAAITRQVQKVTRHDVTEADVVQAAKTVASGQVMPGQGQRFKRALTRVALDSVDYFILAQDEELMEEAYEPEPEFDEEAWLDEFE